MYSRNDYRYYLENRLIHSNDFLAHYGVKGMKWHKKKDGYDESDLLDSEVTIRSGSGETTYNTYGRLTKNADKRADRKQMRKLIRQQNKLKWNKKKSLAKNIESNKRTFKKRRALQKDVRRKVDVHYGDRKPNAQDKREFVRDVKRVSMPQFKQAAEATKKAFNNSEDAKRKTTSDVKRKSSRRTIY